MKIEDYRESYYTHSGKASDVARQLSFAGIALIWVFKSEIAGTPAVPEQLLLPAVLFVASLALDLMQYVFGALIWGAFARHHERRHVTETAELSAPIYLNWPGILCFWLKTTITIAAYFLVLMYLSSLVAKN